MKQILIAILVFWSLHLSSQIGVRLGLGRANYSEFQAEVVKNQTNKNLPFLKNQQSFGVDYWFRLKNRRIEFLPQLSYTNISTSNADKLTSKGKSFDFYFNTQIYIFNLEEDCDCPTFSKQGNTIKKGFFVSVAPLLKVFNYEMTFNEDKFKTNGLAPGLRLGAGIDFGVNDLITITPSINYEATIMQKWEDFTAINLVTKETVNSNYNKLFGEIRIGSRFDNASNNRRKRR